MTTLVPFYKDIDVSNDAEELKDMSQVFDYKNSLNLMHKTFIKYNPTNDFEIQTDLHTQLDFDKIHRTNLNNMNIMKSLVFSNTDYILKKRKGKFVLVGSDHLICNNIDLFFAEDFDVGICLNGDNVNNTVILVNKNKTNQDAVNNFFIQRQKNYESLPEKIKKWYGDQVSVDMILNKYNMKEQYLKDNITIFKGDDNIRIHLFTYGNMVKGIKKNGSYKEHNQNILIDFKGPDRKKYFKEVFNKIYSS